MKTAIIKILDEVNVKIEGADPLVRRKMVDACRFFVPNARHTPAYKLGRWDGYKNLCTIGGRTYLAMLERVLPILIEAGYHVDIDDQRQDFSFIKFDELKSDSYSHFIWPEGHPFEGQALSLYDHQLDVLNGCGQNLQSVYIAPTAAGKTIVTAILSDMIGKYGGSLVIVPTKDLVDQTCEEYHNMGLDYGKFYGDEKNVTAQHIVGTWQSLEQARLNTKKQNGKVTIDQVLDGKVGVIVDETHKAKGTVLLDLLCNEMAHIPIRWGLTGTLPEDEIGQCSLECAVGPTSGKIDNRDLQEKGILSKCHIDVLQTVELYEKIGDYHTENKFLTSDRKRIESIVEKLILPKKDGQNALILVDKIPTGKLLEELIPGSIFVHGGTPKDKRKEAYDLAKTNDDITVIATTGVASTGISINRIFKLFMFELGKSYIKIIQTIGRGLRIAKDKDFVNIYDICANTKYSKKHLTVRKKHYRTHGYPHKVNKVEIY
ncbi:MAG: hypothetical protein CMN60_20340 [Sphingobium sp.]|nr:hypothetical protein [Sphingobium sp.]|tara:strand:+ start:143470 stop:144933 length:1464 start_codon:yes stop_codon:yes gene_type:complete